MIANQVFAALLFFCMAGFAATPSNESVNAFNRYMSPSGGVDMFSGQATRTEQVFSMGGINITLKYSSNTYRNARANNRIAPTGWVGLGWSFGYGSIRCNHMNTTEIDDDEYVYTSPEGVTQKIIKGTREVTVRFYLKEEPYWKLERVTYTRPSA